MLKWLQIHRDYEKNISPKKLENVKTKKTKKDQKMVKNAKSAKDANHKNICQTQKSKQKKSKNAHYWKIQRKQGKHFAQSQNAFPPLKKKTAYATSNFKMDAEKELLNVLPFF